MTRLEFIHDFLKDYESGYSIKECQKLLDREVIEAKHGYLVIDSLGRLVHYLENENVKYLIYVGIGKRRK